MGWGASDTARTHAWDIPVQRPAVPTIRAYQKSGSPAGGVTTDKLVADAVTSGKLVANSVQARNITALAVTADKLAANSVTTTKLRVTEDMTVALLNAHSR